MKTKDEILNTLPYFTCTEQYWRVTPSLKMTDGAKFIRDACEAYWLIGDIDIYSKAIKDQYFQTWELKRVDQTDAFNLIATDGNENEIYKVKVPYSDFPLDSIKFFLIDGILLLPSEY